MAAPPEWIVRLDATSSIDPGHLPLHLALSLLAVLFSWTLLHMVFALRYAHTFYGDADDLPTGTRAVSIFQAISCRIIRTLPVSRLLSE